VVVYVLHKCDVDSISHSFLEVGHTQNENDSVHATIERASRKIPIYTPDQWCTVIAAARLTKPYHVVEMETYDFFDFKELSLKLRNFDVIEEGNQVKWTKLRVMEFVHSEPNTMRVKHAYNEGFETVDLMKRSRKANETW